MKRFEQEQVSYLPWLDGLRAIAIFWVLMIHLGGSRFPWGFMGVDIFFVISGFIVFRNYLSKSDFKIQVFLKRRIVRLFPVMVLVLIFDFFFISKVNYVDYLKVVLYVKNFGDWQWPLGPFWSLSAEMQAYFVLGLIRISWGSLSKKLFICLSCIIFITIQFQSVLVWKENKNFNSSDTIFLVFSRPSEIFLGCIVAYLCMNYPKFRLQSLFYTSSFLLLAMLGLIYRIPLFIALATAILIFWCFEDSKRGNKLRKVFGFRPLVQIGMLSYSIYVWHVSVVIILNLEKMQFYGRPIVSLFSIFIVAYISYNFFELPLQRLILKRK